MTEWGLSPAPLSSPCVPEVASDPSPRPTWLTLQETRHRRICFLGQPARSAPPAAQRLGRHDPAPALGQAPARGAPRPHKEPFVECPGPGPGACGPARTQPGGTHTAGRGAHSREGGTQPGAGRGAHSREARTQPGGGSQPGGAHTAGRGALSREGGTHLGRAHTASRGPRRPGTWAHRWRGDTGWATCPVALGGAHRLGWELSDSRAPAALSGRPPLPPRDERGSHCGSLV